MRTPLSTIRHVSDAYLSAGLTDEASSAYQPPPAEASLGRVQTVWNFFLMNTQPSYMFFQTSGDISSMGAPTLPPGVFEPGDLFSWFFLLGSPV